MLPSYERVGGPKPKIQIAFGRFAIYTVCLPLLSFIFCVIWSVLFFFERSTFTHCDVPNYLPSISAAIGSYQPQRFVWQLAICIHLLPRLGVAKMYVEYYHEIIRFKFMPLAHFACLLNVIENLALLGLSMWTSSDSYETHKFCFILFIATSEIYMLISYFLNKLGKKMTTSTRQEELALKYKGSLFLINIIAFAMAGYFFVRHNNHCEPGVYTYFAFFEYIVVLTNMGYHMTAYWDFFGRTLSFDWENGLYFTRS
ncbi:post-GPI attachment to proteins factor 2-like [Eupeodes corollae]|uniref:post-GPI attachment to proteins factor 2-like n=1 Tax=Eupeodes corollae TaxID=290404 RepID=UPI0024910102|nr:post-GPI attachment to proteins factor 2-like [Eupeodes corollae]